MFVLEWILIATAAALLVPIGVFAVECLASLLPANRRNRTEDAERVRAVVLIPAHNEAAGIARTVEGLLNTLGSTERILVVADNCTDETARIAREAGADVIERNDEIRRGKAYALEFGLAHLATSPPDVVVVIDADCDVDQQLVSTLSQHAHRLQRPVQSLNLAEAHADGIHAVSTLGFRFKNLVRPLGLARLGLPCHLMGTGMALPWGVLEKVSLQGSHLAEDMQLGVDLALVGHPPVFCPEVRVFSRLPSENSAFTSQRNRWERGHLATSLSHGPRLFWAGLRCCRVDLLALAADLSVPPFSLLVLGWTAAFSVAILMLLFGAGTLAAILLGAGGFLMIAAVMTGWFAHCRERIPLRAMLAIPGYVLRKIPIYLAFLCRRPLDWVRTTRDGEAVADRPPKARLFGMSIDALCMEEAVAKLRKWIQENEPVCRYVVTPNVDHVVKFQESPELRDAYQGAAMVLADGMPLVAASRFLGQPLPERVAGSDLAPAMFDAATAAEPLSVFLLGAMPGVGDRAAERIARDWPHVKVVGVYSPPLGFEHDPEENARILDMIRETRPDMLVLGLGAPKQELWIRRHADKVTARTAFCIGATIDFLAEEKPRAPLWMQKCGLEWLHRVGSEPRRLAGRYLRDAWAFPRIVARQWFTQRQSAPTTRSHESPEITEPQSTMAECSCLDDAASQTAELLRMTSTSQSDETTTDANSFVAR